MKVHGEKVCLRFENYTMLRLPQTCPCGSWAWEVSNTLVPYEYPWWKSSFEFWNLYHVYAYGNVYASRILPIWLSLFCKVHFGCFHVVKFASPLPHWELTKGNFIIWTAQCALSYPLFGMYREINVKGFWVQF